MTKIVLQDLASLTNETAALAAINSNTAVIETASDNFLSRDGTTPNQMGADFDMNGNNILNLPEPAGPTEPLRLQDLSSFLGTGTITTGIAKPVPSVSTDNAIVRWDGAVAAQVQNSGVTISDTAVLGGAKVTSTGTSALRTLETRFTDILDVKDFGAVGDGSTNDTAAVTSANTAAVPIFVPKGTYATTLAGTDLDGPYWGYGQIRTGATNTRGSYFASVKSNSAYTPTNEDSVDTAFNGTFTKCLFPVEYRISGATTLTQPTSGYVYSPWAYPYYTVFDNSSGHNNGTADNTGRTAACAFRTNLKHTGQGDAVAYNASVFVNSTKGGSTNFLANPAGVCFNGDMTAGQDGVYLNAGEVLLQDNSKDVAGIGWVVNLNRSVATGAKSAWWAGVRVQSIGSADVNAAYSASGKYDAGLDFSNITTDATKAAIALKADDRIYFDTTSSNGFFATTFNNHYLTYSSSLTAFNCVVNNNSSLQIYSNQVIAPVSLRSSSASGGLGYFTGAGSSVTQITSKSTAVTLNNVVGRITMNNAALGAGGVVSFTVNNNTVAATDLIICHIQSGAADDNTYRIEPHSPGSGTFVIKVTNTSGGSLSEAIVLNYAVIKGVIT